ncbi:MAG: NAD(P)H-hydrate dehydratase [Candidatus Methanomethylophilaceae archaeon]|nr:NAD(P)H-hydrate dehydratase [Candidatus Methanomethylophilaceae archaeon]
MISNLDSRIIDINCVAAGMRIETLMANAGQALADVLKSKFGGKRLLFVCGNGNNGGDGFAAANRLVGEDVTVMLLCADSSIHSDAARKEFAALRCRILPFSARALDGYDVLVDCALGTGVSGKLKEPYATYVEAARHFKGPVVSADIPSGFGTGTAIVPDVTVTFHDAKIGMDEKNSGEIIVKCIGVPDTVRLFTGPGDMLRYPVPLMDSHKGCNGTLMVIGGGPYIGAPALSALAAMRVGIDVVRIAVPASVCDNVASFSPVFIMDKLTGSVVGPGHVQTLLDLSKMCNAVLIGPGLGLDDLTVSAVNDFVRKCDVPLVIDADGLNALGRNFKNESNHPVILTPHTREFLRLGGTIGNDAAEHVSIKAAESKTIILLKGAIDIVSDGDKTKMNSTGNPGMTSAGTGDVLSGIVAGLLAKGMDAFDAAALGAYISGKAGEYAFEEKSYGLIATDVIDKVPTVLVKGLR